MEGQGEGKGLRGGGGEWGRARGVGVEGQGEGRGLRGGGGGSGAGQEEWGWKDRVRGGD